MKLLIVTLNTEVYKQTIGELPDCFIRSCTVNKLSDSNKITEEDKKYAIAKYCERSKFNLTNISLFKFELI